MFDDSEGKVVRVKNANFLLPYAVLSGAFRQHFRSRLEAAGWDVDAIRRPRMSASACSCTPGCR